MSDSSTHLDEISSSQSSKEVTANAVFDAMSPNALFGRRASTTSALTWGYYGGKYRKADGTILTVANGTVALTDSATNYILETDGVVSKVTTTPDGWPGPILDDLSPATTTGANALYAVVCSGGAVTSYTDYRIPGLGGVAAGSGTVTSVAMTVPAELSVAGSPVTTTGTLAVTKATQTANTVWAGPTSGGAAQPAFRALVAADLPAQPVVNGFFFPGSPTASQLLFVIPAPSGITTITYAAAISGSSGKALTAATAQTDIDVRKNATTAANGTSVGTIRFAAAGTVPTFIAASGFTLTGGTDWLTGWGPGTPDATLADISVSLYGTR